MTSARSPYLYKWLLGVLWFLSTAALHAEDIDIFTSTGSGSSSAPTIVFLLDNSANWARSSQHWPGNAGNQGEAELLALKNVLNSVVGSQHINIGLAMYGQNGNDYGAYLRYGARDMMEAHNKTALVNILDGIRASVNSSEEKVAQSEGESKGLYELLKYYQGQAPFFGGDKARNPNLDIAGNTGGNVPFTTVGQGLTAGFAVSGGLYRPPAAINDCRRNFVILIANNSNGKMPDGSQTYQGINAGNAITGTNSSWTDEWARLLYQEGISVYVLDAYNAQNNADYSRVLRSAAANGGGKYYQVGSQEKIEVAIKEILVEVQSVNSTFASASLPVSATNRAQSLNQVFIGMFRPDADAKPRWMGNLKRFQLTRDGLNVGLGDALNAPAVNSQTGFVSDCSASFWTKDTGSYWLDVPLTGLTSSECPNNPTVDGLTGSEWSDLPDGARVEKGGVAEVLRQGNAPPATYTAPTWVPNRRVWTHTAGNKNLVDFSTASTTLDPSTVAWVRGAEANTPPTLPEKASNSATSTRPSIHGDVVHSRPLPVNYGGAQDVTVFYGANDGMLRAVDAATGRERWAFVAPEFHTRFQRLRSNTPLLKYPNVSADLIPTPTAKDYFFDGSIGLYQNIDNTKVWIYPSMRRGGRMLYAFDVTAPETPVMKWRVGCTGTTSGASCTSGFEGIGQTWSAPSVAFLKGHPATTPVLIVGGGYDTCEDADVASPPCTGRKGNAVFVIDADTGALLRSFPTIGSVAADVALADTNTDGSVDYAYATTTEGNIYRIDFSSPLGAVRTKENWAIRRVAYTNGSGRKFLYPPSLFHTAGKMYVSTGSGDRERPLISNYPYTSNVINRFYTYVDDLAVESNSVAAATDLDDSNAHMANYSSAAGSTCSLAGATPASGLKGWFMDLPGRGEQTITSPLISGGMITFNTNRPLVSSASSCTNPLLGESRGYWVNLLNASGGIGVSNASCGGTRSSIFTGGGLTPSPTVASVSIGGQVTTVVIGAVQRSGGASSGIAPQAITPSIKAQRRLIYWKSDAASQ